MAELVGRHLEEMANMQLSRKVELLGCVLLCRLLYFPTTVSFSSSITATILAYLILSVCWRSFSMLSIYISVPTCPTPT